MRMYLILVHLRLRAGTFGRFQKCCKSNSFIDIDGSGGILRDRPERGRVAKHHRDDHLLNGQCIFRLSIDHIDFLHQPYYIASKLHISIATCEFE